MSTWFEDDPLISVDNKESAATEIKKISQEITNRYHRFNSVDGGDRWENALDTTFRFPCSTLTLADR